MTKRYLYDPDNYSCRQSIEDKNGAERLTSIPQYPKRQSELPPLIPWHWCIPLTIWKLVRFTIVGTILVGSTCMVLQWGGDMFTGMLRGIIVGGFMGIYLDCRFAMVGGSMYN